MNNSNVAVAVAVDMPRYNIRGHKGAKAELKAAIQMRDPMSFTRNITAGIAEDIAHIFGVEYLEAGGEFKFIAQGTDRAWDVEDFLDDLHITNASVNA